jgi:hypothetical protein
MTQRYAKAMSKARKQASDLAGEVRKYATPVESGPRKKVYRKVNTLNAPEDAGGSYGSNYGPVS